jgi:aryl-alcohol dehydrogenase-like predicted oxidoreductase
MKTIKLGAHGPVVGIQGLGCMGMSAFYGDSDLDASRDTLEAALEAGITLFDTADMYGDGENERFLASFFGAHRDEITIATKFGFALDEAGDVAIRNEPAYIREAAEASLHRLNVDVIDLYYMHRRNPDVPLAESIGALAELVQQGKVKHLGLSEVSGDELREAYAIHPIAAVESEWSLFARDVEDSAVPAAAELGVGLVPYSPLGRGFLTGAFVDASQDLGSSNEARGSFPRFSGENAKANAALLKPMHEIAAAHDATPAQIALAWVQQRAQVHGIAVVPIPGTRKRSRLQENVAATQITLSGDELAQLEPIAGQVKGERYPDMARLM